MIKADELRRILHYDSATGEFRWLVRRSQRVLAGMVAGYRTKRGYRSIGIGGREYLAHQLAWLYVHGKWPRRGLDHINRRPDDNRIVNLRLATESQNQANAGLRSDNSSGLKGVSFHKETGKWGARINYRGRSIHLGLHETPAMASAVYLAKYRKLFGEFVPEDFR